MTIPVKIQDLWEGDCLMVMDDAFTCMTEGSTKIVTFSATDAYNLCVFCSEGRHDLCGQVDDDGFLVGLEKVEKTGVFDPFVEDNK